MDPVFQLAIRRAAARDADFLAWAILSATRSHIARGWFDIALDRTETEYLDFLRRLALTSVPSWWHHSRFFIADVAGEPAAALCAFQGVEPYALSQPALAEVCASLGWSDAEQRAVWERGAYLFTCSFEAPADTCHLENIATKPEHRGRGLATRLIEHAMQEGGLRHAPRAQIVTLIGNDAADRAYRHAGFSPAGESRSAAFESATGVPGLRRYVREPTGTA